MTAHKHILDWEKAHNVGYYVLYAVPCNLPLSLWQLCLHSFFILYQMESNMHQSRHHGPLYERADGLREWWPACCQCLCFSLKSREMRAIWRVHRSDSWLTCHGNTVLSHWTNGPHLPKANIKHTERKQCLTPIGSVVSALLTLLWPSPLPLCNCLPTWWKCSRLGFCHSEILVNPSANMCCVREHEYDMLISLILKDFTMIHLKEFLALGTHSYIPTVFVFFFCEIHVNGEHVKQDFIELWLYGFIRLRIQCKL